MNCCYTLARSWGSCIATKILAYAAHIVIYKSCAEYQTAVYGAPLTAVCLDRLWRDLGALEPLCWDVPFRFFGTAPVIERMPAAEELQFQLKTAEDKSEEDCKG